MSSSLTLGQAPKSTSTPPPAGNHVARCYSVVDCGTHTETGQFGTKTNRKIKISWELPDELHTFKEERGPEPFSVHKQYNFSINEKSSLRKDLESWRGRAFTPEELESFDLKNLVGAACMLNVVHEIKQDRTYANIHGISPVPKSLKNTLPAPHNAPVFWTVGDGQNAVFSKLPEFMQKYILEAAEFTNRPSNNGLAADGSIEEENENSPF